MHRTEGTNHEANLFQDGPPGTRVEKDWLNAVQEEIAHVIEDAGITLRTASTETRDQLLTAILAFINVSGFFFATMIKTSSYTVESADKGKLILADATAGDMIISLPAPNVALDGFAIGIKKIDSSGNKVTLDPVGAAHIEGINSFDLMLPNGNVIAICNGTEYFLISLNEITSAMCAVSLKAALIKAWVTFDGIGVVVIKDSYNVSSVVDNGVGDYTINWDADFANTDYCFWGSARDNEGAPSPLADLFLGSPFGGIKTVGSLQVMVTAGVANLDSPEVCVAAIGDQA